MTDIITIGEIPFDKLQIGDHVISCVGRPGIISELYPIGTIDPYGRNWDDWLGGIKILWRTYGPEQKFSTVGWNNLTVIYIGKNND